MEWENVFANYMSVSDFMLKIHKELEQLRSKKTTQLKYAQRA